MSVPLCAVTGTLVDLLGNPIPGAKLVVKLIHHGINQPRVLGNYMFAASTYVAIADSVGNVSFNIVGNDQIDPTGTLYSFSTFTAQGIQIGSNIYNVVGSSFDPNSATPVFAYPINEFVIVAPAQPANALVINVTAPDGGPFTVAHGFGSMPFFPQIYVTGPGFMWWSPALWDATNLYLESSAPGVTAKIKVW